jgi:hypothetical protein
VQVVPEALVDVRWHAASWFFDRWAVIVEALLYLIAKHPDLLTDRHGAAVLYGRLAFCEAALGHRRASAGWLWATLRSDPRELRWVLTLPLLITPAAALPVVRLVRRVSGRSV